MATKRKKQLLRKLDDTRWIHYQQSISNPACLKDFTQLKKAVNGIREEMQKIADKGKGRHVDDPRFILFNNQSYNLQDEFKGKWGIPHPLHHLRVVNGKLEVDEIVQDIWDYSIELDQASIEELHKGVLPGKRTKLSVKINFSHEKEIILAEFSRLYDWIGANWRERGIKIPHEKKHLTTSVRRCKVFKLRDQKPPMKFNKIALRLLASGSYKDRTLVEAENLAIKDYAEAFRMIYGIPYKERNKSQLKASNFNGCASCEARQKCKELCSQAAYFLSLHEKKQSELLFNKGVTDVIDSKDLKEAKQRKRVTVSEDENWRQEEFERGMYKK